MLLLFPRRTWIHKMEIWETFHLFSPGCLHNAALFCITLKRIQCIERQECGWNSFASAYLMFVYSSVSKTNRTRCSLVRWCLAGTRTEPLFKARAWWEELCFFCSNQEADKLRKCEHKIFIISDHKRHFFSTSLVSFHSPNTASCLLCMKELQ